MRSCLSLAIALMVASAASADDSIRLANNPSLSPDGSMLAFDWNGDIWVVPSAGGDARPLTQHPARDRDPKFSPDGKEIAFISDRDGSNQVYVMPSQGGTPQRLTYHTAGYGLEGWTRDGSKLLVTGSRDHYWNGRQAMRFFLIDRKVRPTEEMLFDDYGQSGSLSPDGRKLLFTREGTQWWRKGYYGTQAAQIWQYDLDSKAFTKIFAPDRGCTNALWKPDGSGCYVVSAQDGTFTLYDRNLETGSQKQLTKPEEDSIVQPCISADGKTIVFRRLFDLYRFQPGRDTTPLKLAIRATGDRPVETTDRRVLTQATDMSYSGDGLEVAFAAGGDIWVMDTELKEPKRITTTAEEDRDPRISADGQFIFFVSEMYGECNVWRAEKADRNKYLWQNREFKLRRLTQDAKNKAGIKLSPDGTKLGFIHDRGDLCVMDIDGSHLKTIVKSFSPVEFDWSPDGKWLVYAADDNDFNRDIWVTPLDGSVKPYNISRSPFNDTDPVWSPDGKVIAYVGRSTGEEMDIHYVYLRAEDDQTSSRDRTLEKAIDKLNRARRSGQKPTEDEEPADQIAIPTAPLPQAASSGAAPSIPKVTIDFEKLHERVRVISIPDSTERELFWSPEGKKLAFTAQIDGQTATYVVDLVEDLRPKLMHPGIGTHARWLRTGQVIWQTGGLPGSFNVAGVAAFLQSQAAAAPRGTASRSSRTAGTSSPTVDLPPAINSTYRFQALQEIDRRQKNASVFDLAWRTMRDNYYDERFGNHDWDVIRRKYFELATDAPDQETLGTVVNLMLGELNGSHLGFFLNDALPASLRRNAAAAEPGSKWTETTAHLGLRFDPTYAGPGLKVRDVISGGPADKQRSRVKAGDIVTKIDDQEVNPGMDMTKIMNVGPGHEFSVRVKSGTADERTVAIQPISFPNARTLLYKQWVDGNAKMVEKLSEGKLGYLHIDAMAMPSFYKFQEELFSIGAGKEGLVIDVRENGGGSTADHLLTSLVQPVHAITVPRGGGQGYPQDRKVYASWNKPIVVLCNQNSFSNAEIFAHAIKTLKRGQVVGVQTAGGVISTGGTEIMDVGFLRLPFRGWYSVNDGRDMELNGAMPDYVVWPEPGQMANGKDIQLEKGVAVLTRDVAQWNSRPKPQLIKASELEPGGRKDRPLVKEGPAE